MTGRPPNSTLFPYPPLSRSPPRLLVRAYVGAAQERHAERAPARLRRLEQALPDPEMAPAIEGLCRPPPRPEFGWDAAPLRPIVGPPDNRLDRATQVVMLRLAAWAARLNQRLQRRPLRVGQNTKPVPVRHPPNMETELKG